MSKKRPTESSWDSDEELLDDTSGITAFPAATELELLGGDGDLDEDALLGMDDNGAKSVSVSFTNDSLRVTRRQSSRLKAAQVVVAEEAAPIPDEQAFVFEDTDTADLENELNVEEDSSYDATAIHHGEGYDASEHYPDAVYDHQEYANVSEEQIHTSEEYPVQSEHMAGDYTTPVESHEGYAEVLPDGDVPVTVMGEVVDEHGGAGVELEYDQPAEHDEAVHLEYADPDGAIHDLGNGEPAEDATKYESESDNESEDGDSRHNRGKFTTERTGKISLTSAAKRSSIPDTLEIDDEQAAQIEEFMTDKSGRGRGRGAGRGQRGQLRGRGGRGMPQGPQGRPSVHSRLGPRGQNPGGPRGPGPNPGPGLLTGPQAEGLQANPTLMNVIQQINMRGQMLMRGPPPGPMGPRGPRGPRGPPFRGPGPRGMGPGPRGMGPRGMRGPPPPGMRGPPPPGMRGPPPPGMRGPPPPGMRGPPPGMQGPPPGMGMRGPPPGMGPRGPMGPPNMRMGGPRGPGGPGGPGLMGPPPMMPPGMGPPRGPPPGPPHPDHPEGQPGGQPIPSLGAQPGQQGPPHLRVHINQGPRFPGPPNQQMGPRGPLGLQNDNNRKRKIFINPRFQGQQQNATPTGITRTVRIGAPLHQKKAKLLLQKAKQTQIKGAAPIALKRKSGGGDEIPAKAMRTDNKEPEEGNKIESLLEQQKRQRELIQKRKEEARLKQAEEKRKTLGDSGQNDNQPTGITRRIESRLGPPPNKRFLTRPSTSGSNAEEHSGPQAIKVLSSRTTVTAPGQQTSQAPSFRGPPPQNSRMRGPGGQQRFPGARVNGPMGRLGPMPNQNAQNNRGPRPQQQVRFVGLQQNANQLIRGPPPQRPQMSGPPPRPGGNPQGHRPPFPTPPPGQQLTLVSAPPPRIQASPQRPPPGFQSPPPGAPPFRFQNAPPPRVVNPPQHRPPVVIQPPPQRPPPPQQYGQAYQQPPRPQSYPAYQPPASHPPPTVVTYGQPAQVIHQAPPPASPVHTAPPPARHPAPQQHTAYQPPSYTAPTHSAPPPQHAWTSQQPPQAILSHAPPPSQTHTSYTQPSHQQYQAVTPQPSQHYAPSTQASHQYPHSTPAPASQQSYSSQYQAPTSQYSYSPQGHQQIHTISSLSTPSSDHRAVEHHTPPVGQRIQSIQTISARVQPASDMRSIIHNTGHSRSGPRTPPRSPPSESSSQYNSHSSHSSASSSRMVQSRSQYDSSSSHSHESRMVVDGNVPVSDGPQKILITDVPEMATRDTLVKICKHFGKVLGLNLVREQNKAVVQFETGSQAVKCVNKCNQKCLHKTRISVRLLPN